MQLSYELSPDDLAAALRLFIFKRRAVMVWIFSIYGALFLVFGLWQLIRGSVGGALFPLLFGAWGLFYFPVLLPRTAKKNWAKSPILHGPTTFQTSPEGIEISNPMTRAFCRWAVVCDVVEGPKMWLVFISPTYFYVVPKRALASDEERAEFQKEISSRGTSAQVGAPLSAP